MEKRSVNSFITWKLNNIVFLVITLFLVVILSGCGSSIEYSFVEPVSKDVKIEGLEKNDVIIELSDSYKDVYTDGKEFWVVIEKNKSTQKLGEESSNYFIGKIDFSTGLISNLTKLNNYDIDEKSIYWSVSQEDYHGIGQKILNFFGSGDSRKWYVFDGSKYIWGYKNNQILYGYAWNDNSKVVSENAKYKTISTSEDRAIYTTFQNGEQTIFITNTFGYPHFIDDGNHTAKKSRIYKINEKTFIGMQPSNLTSSDEICFFTYELNNQTGMGSSYGAKPKNLNGYYIDAAVDKEGNQVGVIYMKSGKYTLKKYDAMEFAKSIKNFTAN